MKQKELLSKLDHMRITDAITRAERACSGEIKVHVESSLHGRDIRSYAERTFERLGLTGTEQRNGVLLFIAAAEQKFAILGDKGINEKVPPGFWDEIVGGLTSRFRAGEFTDGIVEAIEAAGSELRHYFPYHSADTNELSNEISFGSGEKRE